jgi:hypothetical protein
VVSEERLGVFIPDMDEILSHESVRLLDLQDSRSVRLPQTINAAFALSPFLAGPMELAAARTTTSAGDAFQGVECPAVHRALEGGGRRTGLWR